jgi:hypothetical protein
MAAELAAMGVADADAWADEQREDDDDPDDTLEVWPENVDSFGVFMRCSWQRQLASDGKNQRMVPTGIAASEVRAVAELLGVPRDRWPGVLDDVRLMVAAVLPELQRL